MITGKRTALVVSALAGAAALALAGCAPTGYDQNNGDQVEVANQAAAAGEATPTPDASEGAEDTAEEPTKEVAAEDLTTKLTAKKLPRMGTVVVDQDGFTLYRFDKDTVDPAASNCVDKCAKVWPPAFTEDGKPDLVGIDDEKLGVITRPDGTKQLTLGDWALYRYIGDTKPGQWKGQGVGGTWFVVAPDGKRNLTCLPSVTPKAVEPPADDDSKDGGEDSESGYSY
ncbi:hypothetical protein Pa4123_80830 [Phytohabitans aurantiacus]|uniref:Lipoprotein n=1 Tax=Phytohabitans aurantiacus TaxID=3016789 RepID=A0ABQ5R826_9ACTN|nr:hypothetical protein Pa4123_80830 [Phytohabitans aurantiacus]